MALRKLFWQKIPFLILILFPISCQWSDLFNQQEKSSEQKNTELLPSSSLQVKPSSVTTDKIINTANETSGLIPEPVGIAPGAYPLGSVVAGEQKGLWVIDDTQGEVIFSVVSNSSGLITGSFSRGLQGYFDEENRVGVFAVDLLSLISKNTQQEVNLLRDQNILTAFFAAKSPEGPLADAIGNAWKQIDSKLKPGITKAGFIIQGLEAGILSLQKGKTQQGVVDGKLLLWDSVQIPVKFVIQVKRDNSHIVLSTVQPLTIEMDKILGSQLKQSLMNAMLAAGCAHQAGIQNNVEISLKNITLQQTK